MLSSGEMTQFYTYDAIRLKRRESERKSKRKSKEKVREKVREKVERESGEKKWRGEKK
jgi:hypothetical protein